MKTNIPDHAIPTELSQNNKITSRYTTNILIPRLGPLATKRYTSSISQVLLDYSLVIEALKKASEYKNKYGREISLHDITKEVADDKKPKFDIPSQKTDPRLSKFNSRLAPYSNRREVDLSLLTHKLTSTMEAANVVPVVNKSLSTVISNAINPSSRMGRNIPGRKVQESTEAATSDSINNTRAAEEARDLGNIINLFSGNNAVVSTLVQQGHLRAELDLLSEDLKKISMKPESGLVELIAKNLRGATDENIMHADELLLTAIDQMSLKSNFDFIRTIKIDEAVRKAFARYISDYFENIDILGRGRGRIPAPDDTDVFNSREWAFQRSERLDLELLTPQFRGPVATDSVAPNSQLTTREVHTVTRFSGQGNRTGSNRQRTESQSQSYSTRFSMRLNNMTEGGIQNDSEFTDNATLLKTLSEQRMGAINQTITQISKENEAYVFSEQNTSSQVSREYIAKGADQNQAVTSLVFQVVSPIKVSVTLEGISLVWCPRVIAPFISLHRLISKHTEIARREYLDQNVIIDPVRPVLVYEKFSFRKEIEARGERKKQAYDFKFYIPADHSGWILDKESCVVNFRNGNWDDSDSYGGEMNWDDLPDGTFHTEFLSLHQDGTKISGRVLLQTTNPELLNEGYLTFDIGLKKLSEETRVAIENHAKEHQGAEAQRLAASARANQYARLRRDELIESYDYDAELLEEAYRGLIKQIFNSRNPQHHSYYTEVIRTCINWENVGIHVESGNTNTLPYPHLRPDHYLNTPAIRLTLPIFKDSEDTFFEAIKAGAGTYNASSSIAVKGYVNGYRTKIGNYKTHSPEKLVLDSYDSEIVLGRHLEAVLSRTTFSE